MSADYPSCNIAVWITAVVGKPAYTTLFGSIDELLTFSDILKHLDSKFYLILLQHHKIKMFDALLSVFPHPFVKRRFIYNFSDIFINEIVSVV